MRGINQKFVDDLNSGVLVFFLKQVKEKKELLSLEIRNGYINIYYRGGNLLKISQRRGYYTFHFDKKYCLNKGNDSSFEKLSALKASSLQDYISAFDLMMQEMDSWFEAHPKKEREYQHILLNNNPAIIDIEYQINCKNESGRMKTMRLDMIMVDEDKMIIIENKYGEKSISGNAGLSKHYKDISMVLETESIHLELLDSIMKIANNKFQLGLIEKPLLTIDVSKTEILFLIAAYNSRSKTINNEISAIKAMGSSFPAHVLFAKAGEFTIEYKKSEDLFVYGS